MDQYITGAVIRSLREKNRMTQAELAQKLNVSDKAVSKWETGKGCPDITLLQPIAAAFRVSVAELLSGSAVSNTNVSGNMLRSRFYVCPVCGNVVFASGEAVIACHGVSLTPCEAEPADDAHAAEVEEAEDEYFLRIAHPMTKEHYISFAAALTPERVDIVKLYPEQEPELRLKRRGTRRIYFYCSRDGLFSVQLGRK